jgi:UDP:flavonoid glycosyltransferase YjiC (YdhE family)
MAGSLPPMIVFPCWYDQPGNAARVAFHQIGVRGDIATVISEDVLPLVEAAQHDAIRRNAASMSEIFRAQNDCGYGLTWLEEAGLLLPAQATNPPPPADSK